ncbi:aldolase/citrate lyase family protein [Nocardioides zeae]|uniref:Aldolase/citrate lyase family protein n=1 Tax=Nocardioides imazamoxiresistens TaxID=3231893 RepID=A0ABU3PVJ9_9ACTN|nr:aldolase/citrate lyase family protein [Nocardioides zeae]MDT9592842.1 aldolase/citrate lyase family protein [Nocardioides zeae]
MRTSPRDTFRPGARSLGTWVKLAGPESVEIMAFAGFDFVVLDLEHAPLDLSATFASVSLADALGLTPLVRVPDHAPSTIQKVLDMGAHGLVVPRVQDGGQAAAVARAFSFPPAGTRGAGSTSRAGRWGTLPPDEYVADGRDRALLVVQVESAAAVAAADEIAAVPEVGGILLGSADLALDLGVGPGDAAVSAAVSAVRETARAHGRLFGLAHGADPEAVRTGLDAGNDFALVANDTTFLATAARAAVTAVRASEKRHA